MRDSDLESLRRSINLAQYARSLGYEERLRDSLPGIAVLEHSRDGERLAVARLEGGGIYARIPDYTPRVDGEAEERARRRLRDCILRSDDTGSIVELVRTEERRCGRPESDLEAVRERLASWQLSHDLTRGAEAHADSNRPHREVGDSALPSRDPAGGWEVQARLEKWRDAQRALDHKLAHLSESPSPAPASPTTGAVDGRKSGLASGRYEAPPTREPSTSYLGRTLRGRGGRDEDLGR